MRERREGTPKNLNLKNPHPHLISALNPHPNLKAPALDTGGGKAGQGGYRIYCLAPAAANRRAWRSPSQVRRPFSYLKPTLFPIHNPNPNPDIQNPVLDTARRQEGGRREDGEHAWHPRPRTTRPGARRRRSGARSRRARSRRGCPAPAAARRRVATRTLTLRKP